MLTKKTDNRAVCKGKCVKQKMQATSKNKKKEKGKERKERISKLELSSLN